MYINYFSHLIERQNSCHVFSKKNAVPDYEKPFPHLQVLRVLKTRQVTYSVLTHLSEYIQNLQKTGLLEEKEMVQLDYALQVARIFILLFVVLAQGTVHKSQ